MTYPECQICPERSSCRPIKTNNQWDCKKRSKLRYNKLKESNLNKQRKKVLEEIKKYQKLPNSDKLSYYWFNIGGFSQWIHKRTFVAGCTCRFGSFYKFAKTLKGKECWHIKIALELLEEE